MTNPYERYVAGPEDETRVLLNTSRTAHPTDLHLIHSIGECLMHLILNKMWYELYFYI